MLSNVTISVVSYKALKYFERRKNMSEKKLSRRDFLKGALAGSAAVALGSVTGVAAFAEEKGIYTPGTYSASAEGMGKVIVKATFDANSLLSVDLDVSGETPTIGQAAKDALVEQIMAAQGAEIDGVSSATITSTAVWMAIKK